MPKHDRNRLKLEQIEKFAVFATSLGAGVRPGKGDYQLLQVKTTGPDWNPICRNANGVITTAPSLRELIDLFKETLRPDAIIVRRPLETVICPPRKPAKVTDESAKHYAADLRDDAAVEFMGSLLLKHSAPLEITNERLAGLADLAYRAADALLAAGGHA